MYPNFDSAYFERMPGIKVTGEEANGESTLILSVLGLIGDAAVDVIALVVAGCLAVVSYLCSCRIMKKKEL